MKARRSNHYAVRLVGGVVIEQIPRVHLNLVEREFSSILTLRITRAAGATHLSLYHDHRAPAVGLMRLLGGLPE